MRTDRSARVAVAAVLFVLAVGFSAACRGGNGPEASSSVPLSSPVTLDQLKSVLGAANDYVSGVVDVTQGTGELIIAYRYYDVDLQNYETDFASEMAPRIQALYKKFGSLDRVRFQVTSNNPVTAGLWQSFTEFSLDRKTVEEIHWTGFLARHILDLVIKNKKS